MRFSGFALEYSGPLTRLLHFCPTCLVGRTVVADFSEGATQFAFVLLTLAHAALCRAKNFVNSWEALTIPLTRELQLVLQTVLVFLSPVDLFSTSEASAHDMSPFSVSNVTFFMVSSKISYYPAKVSRACMVFWLRSQALVFASAFFLHVALRRPSRLLKSRCSSNSFEVRSRSLWVPAQLHQHLPYHHNPDSHQLQLRCPWPSHSA